MPNGSSTLSGVMIPTTYSSRPFRCHSTGQWPGPPDVHFVCVCPMPALPPKADIDRVCWDVRFVPKADILRCGRPLRNSADNGYPLLPWVKSVRHAFEFRNRVEVVDPGLLRANKYLPKWHQFIS